MMRDVTPFRQFILKVHSRCDLACDHCYVYEHADQSWRGRPKDGISAETAAQTARRIAEHAAAHAIPEVRVVLHGGEPLLLGIPRTRGVLETLRREISHVARLVLQMHTNGVRLSRDFLDLLAEYEVRVGVSLDGGQAANDLHRLDRRGQSSYDQVVVALALLRESPYRHLYSGLLCTVDLRNDPVEVYRALIDQEPPKIDFLLPHATWANQPPGLPGRRSPVQPKDGSTPYAQWLNEIFDAWDRSGRPLAIRTFDSVLAALHGRPSTTESLGLVSADLLVIEVDGALEQADSLKTAFDGAPATGFDVYNNSLDEAAAHAGITARQGGLEQLCDTCRSCPVVAVCGGGLYAHRYNPDTGFDNPSVYCPDLQEMIMHVAEAEPGHAGSHAATSASETAPAQHSLSAPDFDALAAGYGGSGTIKALAEPQRSIRRNLLAALAKVGPQNDRLFTTAWDRLAALDVEHPQAVETVLAHPYVRAWAVRCLEPAADPDGFPLSGTGPVAEDYAHLASITASAYLHAGQPGTLTLRARDGLVHLPGIGALRVPPTATEAVVDVISEQHITVSCDDGTRSVDLLDPEADWLPVRRLEADGLSVAFDDLDPYRSCHGLAAPRLSDADFGRWRDSFPQAIAFADDHLPRYAGGLRSGLGTVMPMVAPVDGSYRSAAARHAFGAVGASLPDDPELLALLLVHEFQHVKLGALLDLCDLYELSDVEPRHYAPWRPDPRPMEGLLQGTYAHIAVTEFWRTRHRSASGETAAVAESHFARWREHTAEAVEQLLRTGSLTVLGERFVRGMGETVTPWLDEPVSAAARSAAQRSSAEHRASFEEHLRAGR